MRYRFGEFELDEDRYELRRKGRAVDLQPKAQNLLLYLLRHRERTPSKQELVDALWPGVAVSEASLTRAVREVRRALGEHAEAGGILRTVRGRGYRIGVPVEVVPEEPSEQKPPVHRLDRPKSGVFVGREAELKRLHAGLDDALAGHPRIVMLVGEPGIGKTRTAEEFASHARAQGARVLWGRCHEGRGAPPFWPWVQILREYVGGCDPQTLRSEMGRAAVDIATVVSEVRERLANLPDPPVLTAEEARFRFFEGMVQFLRNVSARGLLLIVLDDLQGADEATLLLLEFLACELGPAKLLVLGTYRDIELRRAERLTAALAELARREQTERIPLQGLEKEEVARIIELSYHAAPPRPLVEAIYRRTEGNPFFVHELARLLASGGRLERAPPVSAPGADIPHGVREVVGDRLNRVSDTCNQALRAAAILGREFDVRVLARMVDCAEDALVEALDEALEARLIEEPRDAGGCYRFAHALIRETLYGALHTPRRVDAHRRAGEALEALHHRRHGPHLPEVAYHLLEAVQAVGVERSVDAAVRAADWEATQLAYEDAAAHYRRAIGTLERSDEQAAERLCELRLELARLELFAGNREAMFEAGKLALEGARRLGSGGLFARGALIMYSMGGTPSLRVDQDAVLCLEEALERLGPVESEHRARLLSALALQLNLRAKERERRRLLRGEARQIATRLGDPALLFDVTAGQGEGTESSPVSTDEKIDDLLPLADESVRLARELGTRAQCYALRLRGTMRLVAGDAASMCADVEAAGQLAEELRTAGSRFAQLQLRAMIAILSGRFKEGEELAGQALEIGRRSRGEWAQQIYRNQMAPIHIHRGTLRQGSVLKAMADDGFGLARAALAHACMAEDAREEATHHLELLFAENLEGVPWGLARTNTLCLMAEVCSYLGDKRRAARLYEEMRPYAHYHAVIGSPVASAYLGSFALRLGMLAPLLGRFADAEAHFCAALEWAYAAGAHPWRAHAHARFARMLLTRRGPGDRDRALQQAYAALELAREIKMPAVERDVLSLKLAC